MLKYLIVLLNDGATSFCHYPSNQNANSEISSETLKEAIFWAMKENLSIQFVHSQSSVTSKIKDLINSTDHVSIVPSNIEDKRLRDQADIIVFNDWEEIEEIHNICKQVFVVRTSLEDLYDNKQQLGNLLKYTDRVNVVLTDIDKFTDEGINQYQSFLEDLIPVIVEEYKRGHQVQLNLLTDRLMLEEMNNCNSGYESITLAPDGKFYICPAFYLNNFKDIGSVASGLEVRNAQLYKLSHAPICRSCDAFHCRRCIWLNNNLCGEVNTPSHQQCVIAHIERKVSKKLLDIFREIDPSFLKDLLIPELEYLDPFEKITKHS